MTHLLDRDFQDDTWMPDRVPDPRTYKLYNVPDLDDLPRQEWLIDAALPANALVGLIGPKGVKKTFVALDMAMHVAFGLEWHGRLTQRRSVLYVFSEGAFGARDRVNAWLAFHERQGLPVDRDEIPITFLPAQVPLNKASALEQLIADVQLHFPDGMLPALIIVDTLNRNLEGDEDGKGMTGYVAGCSALQRAFGATVMSVHHTPIGTDERGRGHGAFDGAIDTRFLVSCDDERVTLECTHQRNGPDDWTVAYEAQPYAGSLVLKPSTPSAGELRGNRLDILRLVSVLDCATFTALLRESGLSRKGFNNARSWLVARAYIKQDGRRYLVTDAGRQALGVLGIREVSGG